VREPRSPWPARLLAGWRLAARLAARDLRGGRTGFLVFIACLALGVACITAVGLAERSVIETVRRDGRALLGGDLVVSVVNQPLDDATLRALHPPGARLVRSIHTHTFATAASGRSVAVSLRAVESGWPLYGDAVLEPPQPIERALADGGAVVERTLLARLGVHIGDQLRIGETEVVIRAVLAREPDRVGGLFALGPRLLVDRVTLERAEILLPGALARYHYQFALPAGSDADELAAAIRADFPEARFQVQTASDVEPRIRSWTDRLASYLTLAALAVLLVGALGMALAVHSWLAGKTATIATLKCLGASSGDILRTLALQKGLLTLCGISLGVVVGAAVPATLLGLFADMLPWRIHFVPTAGPILVAAGIGVFTVALVSILPLARARAVSAACLFRSLVAPTPARDRRALFGVGLCALAASALAALAVPRTLVGLAFVALLPALLALLTALALAIRRVARRLAARLASVRWRLACSALARPGSPAVGVVVTLGAGLAVLVTVALVEARLRDEVGRQLPQRAAALFLIDIQPDQRPTLKQLIASTPGAQLLQEAPVVRARVVEIAGKPVEDADVAEDVRWTVQRERALTWRIDPPEGGLVAGAWWPADYSGPPLLSIEERVARGYQVGVGDTIAFNIFGRRIEAEIANIRPEVDWRQGRIDFVFILSPGVLDQAPATWIAALDLPIAAEAGFIDALAQQLPNITPIPMRDVVAQVSEVIARIGVALRIIALLAVLGGLLVLAGAIGASRRRHRYETVLYKILGATRREVTALFLAEYAVLGAAAALVALVLGTVGAWLVLTLLAGLSFAFAPLPVLAVLAFGIGLVLLAGLVGIRKAVGVPAARILSAGILP
jgi:putative ABC transport system permease protein